MAPAYLGTARSQALPQQEWRAVLADSPTLSSDLGCLRQQSSVASHALAASSLCNGLVRSTDEASDGRIRISWSLARALGAAALGQSDACRRRVPLEPFQIS